MNMLSEVTEISSSLSDFADIDTEVSVTSCEYVDDVWVCQTANSNNPDVFVESAQEDVSEHSDILSLDELHFLKEFFLPIADALAEDDVEAWVVPSQYDPMQSSEFIEIQMDLDDNYENYMSYFYDFEGNEDDREIEYFGYRAFEPEVIPLYPRLVRKWRRVPCEKMYQALNPDVLFINNTEPLAEGKVCGMISILLIVSFSLLLCCVIQKIKAITRITRKNQFSKSKTEPLLPSTEAGEGGNCVTQCFKIAVKKKPQKPLKEPYIIFI